MTDMMKFRTLFYMAGVDGKLVDNGIAAWTQLIHSWRLLNKEQRAIILKGFSHEEIWLPDERGSFEFGYFRIYHDRHYYNGTCYTSTMGQLRDKNAPASNGTVKRPASEVLKHPGRWCFAEFEIRASSYTLLEAYLKREVANNRGYGKKDIGKFFGLGFMSDPNRNICSELGNNAMITADILEGLFRVVSPLMSALLVVKAGYKIQELKA